MEIGIFQLLPAPDTVSDREVIEHALWEVDCAEAGGFDSVWIAEHHFSSFGLVGSPSVFAAAVSQRTRRLRIGYAVAVVPLHHPLRLAEEIAWVDHLSRGRLMVGVGPGFSPFELGAYGVPLAERHERLEEGCAILSGALSGEPFQHAGRFWNVPPVTLRPRPFRGCAPPLLRACSSPESVRRAAHDGMPMLLGLAPVAQIAERVAAYREHAAGLGLPPAEIDRLVGECRVLRRVVVAAGGGSGGRGDREALAEARRALRWETETAGRVHHGASGAEGAAPSSDRPAREPEEEEEDAAMIGGCIGTPRTVVRQLAALEALGIRHVIAWLRFGDLSSAQVRRSMELLRDEVMPSLD